jgi:hypothetical protein
MRDRYLERRARKERPRPQKPPEDAAKERGPER